MKTKATKGYVLMLTTAIMTVVALLVSVIFTISVTCTQNASAFNDFNKRKRDIANDCYNALFYNVFYENQIFSYNEKQVLNYCSLEENSLKIYSTDTNYVYGSFILNCINSSYNAEVNFKYSLNTSSKEVIGLTYFSNQNVEEV